MKRLYIGITLALLAVVAGGCTKDTGIEENIRPVVPDSDGNITLVGTSDAATRTGFGGVDGNNISFLWSAGDYIWVNDTRSTTVQEPGQTASFIFDKLAETNPYQVYYNRTGAKPSTALIPSGQTQAEAGITNLGANGDFGYAETNSAGAFTLRHYTSYVWFDVCSADVTSKLVSITLSASGGRVIAGEADFTDTGLGECHGVSSVTLALGEEGVSLPKQGDNGQVFAAMVVYPADLSAATVSVIYTFDDGSSYLTSKAGRTLAPGATLRLTSSISKADCVTDGVHYLTADGWSNTMPETFAELKVVTLGETRLSEEEISSISSKMGSGAKLDLGGAAYDGTEFPETFMRSTTLEQIVLPRNIQTLKSSSSYASAFYSCKALKKATLPDGMTALVAAAFSNCDKLAEINIPASIVSIGENAFYGCKALTGIKLPEGLAKIERSTFQSCTTLATVAIPSTVAAIDDMAFDTCSALNGVVLPEGLQTLGNYVFRNCSALESIVIPDDVTVLGEEVFSTCKKLKEVVLPAALAHVEEEAFYLCESLGDLDFPAKLQTIGARSFGGCNAFTRVSINIPVVTEYSFWDCKGLQSIELGDKVTSIGRNAFIANSSNNKVQSITCRATTPPALDNLAFGGIGTGVSGKKYVYVPAASFDAYETRWATLVSTNGFVFEDLSMQELTDGVYYRASREADWVQTIPQSFTSLFVKTEGEASVISAEELGRIVSAVTKQSAPVTVDLRSANYTSAEFPAVFAGNSKLGVIKFFDNTTAAAAGAFKGCTALTEAAVPAGVATLGAEFFNGCTALASVTVPSSVKTIGNSAFMKCTSLTDITLSGVSTIGNEAFKGSGLTRVSVSASTLGTEVFSGCVALTSATIGSTTPIPASLFAGCTELTGITIPNGVVSIGANAFKDCSAMTSVALGSGVTRIDADAFANCGLTALVLPDQLTTLGDGAFRNNPGIASIKFSAGLSAVGDHAFATNTTIQRLTIPATVTSIGTGSFAGWSQLNTLTIVGANSGTRSLAGLSGYNTRAIGPMGLTAIGAKAFENAVLLADIYCELTVAPSVASDSFSGAGSSAQGAKTVHVPSVDVYSGWISACSSYAFAELGDGYLSDGVYYRTNVSERWGLELPSSSFTTFFVKTVGDNTAMTSAQAAAMAAAVGTASTSVDMSEAVYESATFPAVFKNNANLVGVILPRNVTALANGAFQGTGFTSVHISANIAYGSNAYMSCALLTSVTFDAGVKTIAASMFSACPLASVTIPDQVTAIGNNAFQNCKSLASVTLGSGVNTIGSYAFGGCALLTRMIFPDATQTIEQNAFADCVKLAEVSFGKGMKTIRAYSFTGYGNGGCPLLGSITCRATTPPALEDDYGTIAFGGTYNVYAGKDAAMRVLHLPKSDDPAGGSGTYVDSAWAKLGTDAYKNFQFVYDVD